MMKRTLLAAVIALTPSFAFADDIFGTWQTVKDDNGNYGHIKVEACGSKICGTLIKSFKSDGSALKTDNVGKKLIWDMTNKGGGSYTGGKVYSPDRDKTYKGKIKLNGNKLTVQGCVGPICRDGGTWSRI
ncbi:hypothetical protein GCM10008927_20780 [Amylibacter ulvae]|uniref:DUF2147 domain-containing protein n=1 Tax=Paramylibacter ulvae TaxID=1651968 RepID=A0ABQ3D3I6_9RHOB|nr:DUF2147 domain-containing protein [Amylibacter ulvae]GHA54812.1 hypothetical protein GCM10008927_20780 [Amylibacter ulvae]